jgi:hypothetical protein
MHLVSNFELPFCQNIIYNSTRVLVGCIHLITGIILRPFSQTYLSFSLPVLLGSDFLAGRRFVPEGGNGATNCRDPGLNSRTSDPS